MPVYRYRKPIRISSRQASSYRKNTRSKDDGSSTAAWLIGMLVLFGVFALADRSKSKAKPPTPSPASYGYTQPQATAAPYYTPSASGYSERQTTPAPSYQYTPRYEVDDKPDVAENGSYYGEISRNTGRPKTVHVNGYYRRDGTYVRGHYRSPPRRR